MVRMAKLTPLSRGIKGTCSDAFSLVDSCKALDVDPREWTIRCVFDIRTLCGIFLNFLSWLREEDFFPVFSLSTYYNRQIWVDAVVVGKNDFNILAFNAF